MRAFQVSSFDNAPQITNVPPPHAKKDEVILDIHACGLNFADLLMANGTYQDTPPPPFTLGMEVCGTVTALGPGVSEPAIGTRVAVFGGSGDDASDPCANATEVNPRSAGAGGAAGG